MFRRLGRSWLTDDDPQMVAVHRACQKHQIGPDLDGNVVPNAFANVRRIILTRRWRLKSRKGHTMFVFDSKRTHSFAGPDGTRLSLELPGSWSSVAGAPICLQDTVDGGSLQITPIPPPSSENFRHNMRKFIQPSVDHALLSSVEGSIEVHPFVGEAGVGYYFSAQDRNPKPSGWAFMTQVDF